VNFNVGNPKSRFHLFLPELVVALAKSREGAFVKYDVNAIDPSDPEPVINCEPASGSLFKLGTTTVRCAAMNRAGERVFGDFPVTTYDGVAPKLTIPESFKVDAEGPEGAVVKYETSAFDEISGEVPVSCTPASGARFRVGTTTVACSALDASLNEATNTFDVDVLFDKLVIHVPDKVLAEAEDSKGAYVEFVVTATSPDDPEPRIKCDPPSGEFFAMGTTLVKCIAEDRGGSVAEGQFEVLVSDTVGPIISTVVADPSWIKPDGEMHLISIKIEPFDVVDPAPRCAVTDVTANEPIDESDWRIAGETEVYVNGKSGKAGNRVYTVNVSCTDESRNTSAGNTNVTVSETEPPKQPLRNPAPAEPGRRRAVGRR
jgi:hypothetical protein